MDRKQISKEIVTEDFFNLMKSTNLHIQGAPHILSIIIHIVPHSAKQLQNVKKLAKMKKILQIKRKK
jgi:hypothetical protein